VSTGTRCTQCGAWGIGGDLPVKVYAEKSAISIWRFYPNYCEHRAATTRSGMARLEDKGRPEVSARLLRFSIDARVGKAS
jgi:hypothetical protein